MRCQGRASQAEGTTGAETLGWELVCHGQGHCGQSSVSAGVGEEQRHLVEGLVPEVARGAGGGCEDRRDAICLCVHSPAPALC